MPGCWAGTHGDRSTGLESTRQRPTCLTRPADPPRAARPWPRHRAASPLRRALLQLRACLGPLGAAVRPEPASPKRESRHRGQVPHVGGLPRRTADSRTRSSDREQLRNDLAPHPHAPWERPQHPSAHHVALLPYHDLPQRRQERRRADHGPAPPDHALRPRAGGRAPLARHRAPLARHRAPDARLRAPPAQLHQGRHRQVGSRRQASQNRPRLSRGS